MITRLTGLKTTRERKENADDGPTIYAPHAIPSKEQNVLFEVVVAAVAVVVASAAEVL